jgi:hypothetical protein
MARPRSTSPTLQEARETNAQRTVLPLGRRGRARTPLKGDLGHQIEQAEHPQAAMS